MQPVKNSVVDSRLPLGSTLLLWSLLVQAEVTFDNSAIVPPAFHEQKLSGNMLIPAKAGTQVGSNLFHSFNSFNINKGESVTFTNTGATAVIDNVIGRVTGGSPSHINGLLRSTISNADLYLLNPHGIIFGKSAKLDVRGAFHVSSASSLQFQAGGHLDTLHFSNDILTSAPPQDFGFLNSSVGAVVFNGSQLQITQPLSVTSQHIALKQAAITATGATIALHNPDTSATKNAITLSDATLHTQATLQQQGEIVIQGGNVALTDSYLKTTAANTDTTGKINVTASNDFSLTGGSLHSEGEAGDIRIHADNAIHITNAGRVESSADANDTAGNVILLTKNADINLNNAYVSSTEFIGGTAGRVDISAARNLTMVNGTWIRSDAIGGGKAGSVKVSTTNGDILLNNAHISTMEKHHGTAGTIHVNAAKNLTMQNTRISSNANGGGTAGIVSVMTQDGDISLDNTQITSNEHLQGVAGTLIVSAGKNLTLHHASKITSDAIENGSAGDVTVIAKNGDITVNASKITSDAELHGNAGIVHVRAKNNLNMANFAHIASDAEGGGTAGSIFIQAATINLQDASNISSTALEGGNSGLLHITAENTINLWQYSSFSTASYGGGNAGDIKVYANQLLYLLNSNIATDSSQGLGNGGYIAIDPTFVVLNNSQIIANALRGNGGDITIASRFFLPSADSVVQASSEFGLQGRVSINSTNANIAGSISLLANTFANSVVILQDSCRKPYNSSFISTSQQVLLSPDNSFDYLPSSLNHCH